MQQQPTSNVLVYFALVLAGFAAFGSIPRNGPSVETRLVDLLLLQAQVLQPVLTADPETADAFASP